MTEPLKGVNDLKKIIIYNLYFIIIIDYLFIISVVNFIFFIFLYLFLYICLPATIV